MSLLSLIFSLLLEQLRPVDPRGFPFGAFDRYADLIARNFNAGRRRHGLFGWVLAVLPWVILADVVFVMLNNLSIVLGLAWSVGVLYVTMGLRQFSGGFTAVQEALREGRHDDARRLLREWKGEDTSEYTPQDMTKIAIEFGLASAHRHVFGVIAWYVFLPAVLGTILPGFLGALLCGPGGAGRGCPNSVGAGAALSAAGTGCANNVVLFGQFMPASSSAIYLSGTATTFGGTPFGDGVLCIGGALRRLATRVNVGGASAFPAPGSLTTLSAASLTMPCSGDVRHYQTYYRNAAPF